MFADMTNSAEHCGDNADVGITVPLRARLKKNSFPISCQMAISTVTAHGMYMEPFVFKMHLQANTLLMPVRKLYILSLF